MKNKLVLFIVFTLLFADIQMAGAQIITTIGGNGTQGYSGDGGAAIASQLYHPTDMVKDIAGNIYVCDASNNCIRKVNSTGIIATIAGTGAAGYNGDGILATDAQISYPSSITIDAAGNLFFTDDHNYRIRKISSSGIISTIAGTGTVGYNGDGVIATSANIGSALGVEVDASGNIYFDDIGNYRIRKINSSGIISTIAGTGINLHRGDNGPATSVDLAGPLGLAIDKSNNLYFAEYDGSRIRKISSAGIITTVAGTGTPGYSGDGAAATLCELRNPFGVAVDNGGNLYIPDADSRIRKITADGIITTVVGNGIRVSGPDGGLATNTSIADPQGIKVDASGCMYIAEWGGNKIRYIRNADFVNNIVEHNASVKIYPNPGDGNFSVDVSTTVDEKIEIIFSTITGRELKRIPGITNKLINVGLNAPSGVYLLRVINGDDTWSKKVVVAK